MDGGFPYSRLAAALVLSLTAHLVIVWSLGALLGQPGGARGGDVLVARLEGTPSAQPAAPAPRARASGSDAIAAAPIYWPVADLDVRPQIRTHVMPEYPPELVSGIRGRVVLELFISRDGTLDRVRVARSEPRGRFEQAAVKAFSGARFTPGMRKGKAVPSLLRIEVTFGD